ncbi:hypothetical protein Emed_000416 [Eimeria media]
MDENPSHKGGDTSASPDSFQNEGNLSRHAFKSTWDDIYQRELEAAASRRSYAQQRGRQAAGADVMPASRSSSRESSRSSTCSDNGSMDGEEWFEPECAKIEKWVCSTLQKQQDNPLQLFIQSLHASHLSEQEKLSICEEEHCMCHMLRGPPHCFSLPILDVGCGGGQFLARLRRCGFVRLAGVDYSASAICLAKANLLHRGPRSSCHMCLRQADLRSLQLDAAPLQHARPPSCFCCRCERTAEGLRDSAKTERKVSSEAECSSESACTCEPLSSLPPFPVVFDKGTFDVFWLMHTPEVYVECMHRLMPQYAILFLTSCNCTVEELDSIFCAIADKQHPLSIAADDAPENKDKDAKQSKPFFERIDLLPHRSFKFGGVTGQVVTTVLLRRL